MMWTLPLMFGLLGCTGTPNGGFGQGGSSLGVDTNPTGSGAGGDGGGQPDTGPTDTGGGASDSGSSGDTGDTGIVPCSDHGVDWTLTEGLDSGNLVKNMTNASGWSLWEHCGRPAAIVVGHLYDQAYIDTLAGLVQVAADHSDLLTIAFIGYNAQQNIADAADASTVQAYHNFDVVFFDPTMVEFNAWAQSNPPKTYLVDSSLVIQWVNQGFTDPVQLADKIDAL